MTSRPSLPGRGGERLGDLLNLVHSADTEPGDAPVDACHQPAEYPSGADFESPVDTGGGQRLHALDEPHRGGDLLLEEGRIRAGSWFGAASTFVTTGTRGAAKPWRASSGASFSAAGCIRAQWKGAETGRSTARLAPASRASSVARATAAVAPAITVCCGELKFAGETTWPVSAAARSQASAITSGAAPITAAMAPSPWGTASCMKRPRAFTSTAASSTGSAPAATSAVYSPRLWPATKAGASATRSSIARSSAMLVTSTAGCWISVRRSSSSGPSKQSRESGKPRASSAASKTARAAADAS